MGGSSGHRDLATQIGQRLRRVPPSGARQALTNMDTEVIMKLNLNNDLWKSWSNTTQLKQQTALHKMRKKAM